MINICNGEVEELVTSRTKIQMICMWTKNLFKTKKPYIYYISLSIYLFIVV